MCVCAFIQVTFFCETRWKFSDHLEFKKTELLESDLKKKVTKQGGNLNQPFGVSSNIREALPNMCVCVCVCVCVCLMFGSQHRAMSVRSRV